jgi:hypothetical protein
VHVGEMEPDPLLLPQERAGYDIGNNLPGFLVSVDLSGRGVTGNFNAHHLMQGMHMGLEGNGTGTVSGSEMMMGAFKELMRNVCL